MSTSPAQQEAIRSAQATALAAARRGLPARDQTEAEDLAAEAMLRLAAQPELPENPDAWVTRVVGNLLIDRGRRLQARGGPPDALEDEEFDGRRAVADFVAHGMPASAPVDGDALTRLIDQLSTLLSARELAVLGRVSQNMSYDEIAMDLGYKNADTVKSTVRKIRSKVQDELEEFRRDRGHPRVYD